jgi:serine/threonine protein kinase
MTPENSSREDSLRLSVAQRVDQSCDRFEAEWRAGQRPRIEAYLTKVSEAERPDFVRQLLALEIELRRENGENPTADEYATCFPQYLELIRAVFAEALTLTSTRAPQEEGRGLQGGQAEPTTVSCDPSDLSPLIDATPPHSPESPPTIPGNIGRYRICGKLGGGTFGNVYMAQDDLMDRRVAIKVPSPKLLASQRARDQFLTEARSVGRLQHEGIVRAYDFGQEADGNCYIVYELIDGTNLRERIKSSPNTEESLTADEAARVVAQVAQALHYAHLQGLVHRDIKPENILLDPNGKPRVTDFGLAVREDDQSKERGRFAGSLPYMSPEQVRCEGDVIDGRSDVFSLGVVLYELLCGRRPFVAKTQDELEDQILHREAKPLRQVKDSIPEEMERICLKALSKRMQDRYTTAGDLAEHLQKAIAFSPGRSLEGNVTTGDPIRVLAHWAVLLNTHDVALFINVTNVSGDDLEVTHIWIESTPKIHILNDKRPLPRRLKPQESWETWVVAWELPEKLVSNQACSLIRARISSGVVVHSKKNEDVPSEGYVPGQS